MCLATTQKNPKIAKKAITTYKFLEDLSSPYQSFDYELGKTYSTLMEESSDKSTYDDISTEALKEYRKTGKKIRYIGPGFHSVLKKARVKSCNEYRELYICTIPKGAKYYTDNTGLIVSDKIKIRKEIDKNEL
jgi:hypothetical protein